MPLRLIYSSSREKWIHLSVSGPFCYWTLSENTSKHQDHISQSAFFSKVRVVLKLTKKCTSQQNSFFFSCFSGLVSFLIPSAVCVVNPFFCVWLLLVPIKPALKLLSPSPMFWRGSNGNRQWECLAAAAHISQLLPPSSLSSRNDCGTPLLHEALLAKAGWFLTQVERDLFITR